MGRFILPLLVCFLSVDASAQLIEQTIAPSDTVDTGFGNFIALDGDNLLVQCRNPSPLAMVMCVRLCRKLKACQNAEVNIANYLM